MGGCVEAPQPAPAIPLVAFSARFVDLQFYPDGTPDWVHWAVCRD
jgi:hypothetical protein